ncbi:MAG: Ig-like domain-containing protein [Clostridia bacterium]|nr:Ig-like domain-containing protein [Clostridia bacterium]
MDTGDSDVEEVMFEIPDTMTEVEIIPLVENAEFEYLDESYTFGDKIKDAVGVLKLASLNDEGIKEKESNFVIKSAPKKVNSVNVEESLNLTYKSSGTLVPQISADSGARYTVAYSSSNTSVASVDANGKITTNDTGSATITCTVTDEHGNVVTDTCEVNVSYSWWQWIIVIVLFGWIWY